MDLSHLFQDEVTWSEPVSYSDGDLVQGALTTAKGRLEESYQLVKISGGEERAASYKFATADDIPMNARVYVPDSSPGSPGESLTVLKRETARTLDGSYRYYILSLGL